MSILFIDDNEEILDIMMRVSDIFCDEVYIANNAIEALKIFKEKEPDIVICDILMPGMNGIELSENIFKLKKNQKIIIVSGVTDDTYRTKAKELGIFAYLNKPLNLLDLKRFIEK